MVKPVTIGLAEGASYALVCILGGLILGFYFRRAILPRGSLLSEWQFGAIVFGTLVLSLLLSSAEVWMFAQRVKGDFVWVFAWIVPTTMGSVYGFKIARQEPRGLKAGFANDLIAPQEDGLLLVKQPDESECVA